MKTTVPIKKVKQMLENRLGNLTHFFPLTEGLSSQAFKFSSNQGSFVIRINRSINGFKKDEFVFQNFANEILPIPKVVEINYMEDGEAYCISHLAPGIRVHDLEENGQQEIVQPIIKILNIISSTDITNTTGYG